MTEHEPSANPYHAASSESTLKTPDTKALKYIAHGIYLQLFLGVGFLAISASGFDPGPLIAGPKTCGVLLIGLGLNSLIYIHRYKKSIR